MIGEWWRTALGQDRTPSEDQIRAITAPHTGRHSVDAGAGTGKTSTLALRALWLIESEYVRADQIVVVTFTNKAAAEIGSRIADTIDRAIENGAQFANGGRGVRSMTLHGLASEIRREFAFDLGFDAPPTAIGDGEAHAIFHEAFATLLDGRLDVDTSVFPVAEINVKHLERDLGKLALRLKNHGISLQTFEARALVEAERFGKQSWGQLYKPGVRQNTKKELMPAKEPFTTVEIAREAERERSNIGVVVALFAEFDRLLHERGAATYGDLIGATTEALLKRPQIVRRLRARWRYVLLDESQDTSELQLAFIETIFGKPGDPDAAGMMPVGDGRQAIYGFNGADELVMQRLARVAEKTHPLFINRRSFQEIVDAAHAVLQSVKLVDATLPKLSAHNGARGLTCVRLQNFGVAGQSIKERVDLEGQAIAGEVARLITECGAKMSDIAILVRRRTHAAAYMRALNRRGVSAALDRRSGLFVADEIRDALAWMAWLLDLRSGQAAVRVLQSPLCGLSDATMIALTEPRDWLERFLHEGPVSTLDSGTRERLAQVQQLLVTLIPSTSLPLTAAMELIFKVLPIAASYVNLGEREGAETIGAQAVVNLASFDLLAREFATEHPGAHLREFVDDVERRILYDDDVQEAELDIDGVRILTVHQAKGLEWRYVFVACSTKNQYGTSSPSDRVVIYDLSSGGLALKNDVDGRETFRWLCLATEHDRSDGKRLEPGPIKASAEREQARVFYVALTRARECVYITAPAPQPDPGKKSAGEAPFLQSIRDWAHAQDAEADLRFAGDLTPAPVVGRRIVGTPRAVPRPVFSLEPVASTYRPRISFTSISAFETCPRQARYRYRLLLPDLRDARPRFVGLDGNETPLTTNAAALGSLTHRALELWAAGEIEARREAASGTAAASSFTYDEAFDGARLDFADVTSADASRARESGKRAVEALVGYTLLNVEEAFELGVGQTLVLGAVDLIARDPDGTIVVIDYKTGMLAGEKYALQLALYRRVAEERYQGESVRAAILRLSPDRASFETALPVPSEEVDRLVAAVGQLTSDEAKVGAWCDRCAYRGSPCLAPLGLVG